MFNINLSTPLVVTQTTQTTFISFTVVHVSKDIPESNVILTVSKTDSNGIISLDTFTLNEAELAAYNAVPLTAGELFPTADILAANAAALVHYAVPAGTYAIV